MHTFALLLRSAFHIACSGSGSGPGAGTVLTVVSLFCIAMGQGTVGSPARVLPRRIPAHFHTCAYMVLLLQEINLEDDL